MVKQQGDHKTINGDVLATLQPRQLEQLYWMAKGNNGYGVAYEMGLSNKSIPLRQNAIRKKLGLNKHFNLMIIAKRNKKWILKNAKVKGGGIIKSKEQEAIAKELLKNWR